MELVELLVVVGHMCALLCVCRPTEREMSSGLRRTDRWPTSTARWLG